MRFQCRLRELAFFEPSSTAERLGRIAASIERLSAGRYLIGLGPNCNELIRVGAYPIRFGRHASVLEEPHEMIIDYAVNDASLHGPREVSRYHCTIDPTTSIDSECVLIDEGSSTGTWLQPASQRIEPHDRVTITHGAMFSLGPSAANLVLLIAV